MNACCSHLPSHLRHFFPTFDPSPIPHELYLQTSARFALFSSLLGSVRIGNLYHFTLVPNTSSYLSDLDLFVGDFFFYDKPRQAGSRSSFSRAFGSRISTPPMHFDSTMLLKLPRRRFTTKRPEPVAERYSSTPSSHSGRQYCYHSWSKQKAIGRRAT